MVAKVEIEEVIAWVARCQECGWEDEHRLDSLSAVHDAGRHDEDCHAPSEPTGKGND